MKTSAIADTGAQSDLWSLEEFTACGFSRDDLRPVSLSLSAANRSPIAIEGAFFAKLTAAPRDGTETTCRSMVYVSSSVRDMYLYLTIHCSTSAYWASTSHLKKTQRYPATVNTSIFHNDPHPSTPVGSSMMAAIRH